MNLLNAAELIKLPLKPKEEGLAKRIVKSLKSRLSAKCQPEPTINAGVYLLIERTKYLIKQLEKYFL